MNNLDVRNILGEPDLYIRGEPSYTDRRCKDAVVRAINNDLYFNKLGHKMSENYEKATVAIDKAQEKFDCSINKLIETERKISIKTKEVSENVRKSTQKLNEGLVRIEKQANFDKLEKYVNLLERAEKAISALAELEKTGRLEKIANAIN